MTLEEMKEIDIRTVDPESLVDIRTVAVDPALPRAEKLKSFVKQIKNPYCYKYGEIIVKISFANNGKTLEDCLEQYLRTR